MPTELIDACQEHPHREAWAQTKCGILKTPIFSVSNLFGKLFYFIFHTAFC